MAHRRNRALALLALGVIGATVIPAPAGATVTRTSGTGQYVNLSWTEYDPDDVLGLPGNVHVGYLYVEQGPYGSYVYGNVTDFDCDEGEVPYGGGHGVATEALADIVDEGGDTVADATEDTLQDLADGGATTVDADVVTDAIKAALDEEITDEFEEIPVCDYVQDRFLEGDGTVQMTVDARNVVARLTGTVNVTNGGHGEPGEVLASPPIDVTITGGEWSKYESSYKVRAEGYRYSSWQEGTDWYGGAVTGRIGAMGFDDDADDESFAGFSTYQYRTVDRVR